MAEQKTHFKLWVKSLFLGFLYNVLDCLDTQPIKVWNIELGLYIYLFIFYGFYNLYIDFRQRMFNGIHSTCYQK